MFLRSTGHVYSTYQKISRRLLSNQIKEVLSTRLDPPSGTNGNQLQLSFVSKNLNALDLDIFVNNLSEHEDRCSTILGLLENLRATKLANTCLESTHFAVIRHLLENSTIQEVVPVLLDRPKYGIFLNDFTSFIVAQALHDEKEYILGLSLALKLVLSGEIDSVFVQGFCVKALWEALKRELSEDQSSDEKHISTQKGKVQEKKIRVKYIRNVNNADPHTEMGKACLKIGSNILQENNRENIKILGFVLTKNYAELDKTLSKKSVEIHKDLGDICKQILLRENQSDFINKIDQMQSNLYFENFIDEFLKETSTKESVALSEKQKLLLPIWQQQREQRKLEFDNEAAQKERKDTIEEIRNEIATKKELLWFFDNEDKLDMDIFKKQVFYPKRWFGKKKKPRIIDDNYVPPQIRKIK